MERDGITFLGDSGKEYVFSICKYPADLPSIAAVYALIKRSVIYDGLRRPVSEKRVVIYFGQSGNLKERFENHSHEDCFAKHGATHIGIWTEDVSTQSRREKTEKDLVHRYQPPCNDTER